MALLTFQADRKVEQYLNKAAIGSASGNITLNSYDQWRAECMVERQIDAYNEGTIEYEAVNEMVSLLLGYTDSEMFTQSLTEKAERLDALCVSKKMFAQGQSYANQGQFLDAVRQYVQVIEFDSNYVEAQRQIKALSDLVDSPEQSDDTPHDASSMNEFERALIMIGLYFAAVAAPILILRYLIKSKFGWSIPEQLRRSICLQPRQISIYGGHFCVYIRLVSNSIQYLPHYIYKGQKVGDRHEIQHPVQTEELGQYQGKTNAEHHLTHHGDSVEANALPKEWR